MRRNDRHVNAVAWLLWFAAVAAVPIVSRNPFYLALGFIIVLAVYLALPKRTGAARAWRLFAMVGSSLSVFAIGFNVLTVHVGDRVFATLPEHLPIIGGDLTWNAFAYGALSALAISTLLVAAATFNTAVRHADLVRLMPDAFSRLGVATSIAIAMVPQTIASARDIYDAQRARGVQFRGARDAHGFIVPLLATSLERALLTSEALETRGFGSSADPSTARTPSFAIAGSSVLLLAALAALGAGQFLAGLLLLAFAITVALRATNGQTRRSRFRTLEWSLASRVVAGFALVALLALLTLPALTGAVLRYEPFPRLTMPGFEPLVGGAMMLLLAPIFWPSE